MPTKRKRVGRGAPLALKTILLLGIGTGFNHYTEAEIREIWRLWGDAFLARWGQGHTTEPWIFCVARAEGWRWIDTSWSGERYGNHDHEPTRN